MRQVMTLLVVSLCQMGIAAVMLNTLRMEHWSAVYAEDSEGYLLVARYFRGEEIPHSDHPLLRYRLFSPVVPFIASLISRIIPLPASFIVLNGGLWLISVCLFYQFAKGLLDHRRGYYCALLYTTSLPLIIWGLPIMTEMAAFTCAILNCLLITRVAAHKRSFGYITACTLPLAILTKPTLVSLLLFFILYLLLKRRYRQVFPVALATLLLVLGVYQSFGLGVKEFQVYGYLRHQGLFYIGNAFLFCFHWGIPLAAWGMWGEKHQRIFYLTYFISSFGCYLLFVHNPRLLFIVFPAVLPLITIGMERWAQRIAPSLKRDATQITPLLVAGYMVTSNILTVLYLYITRVLQYRSLESVGNLFK